jgi:hypothetical protein
MTKLLYKHYFEYCGNKMIHWFLTLQIKPFLRDFTIWVYHRTNTVFGNATATPISVSSLGTHPPLAISRPVASSKESN